MDLQLSVDGVNSCLGDPRVGGLHLGQHRFRAGHEALDSGFAALRSFRSEVHSLDVGGKLGLQLVHSGGEVGLKVSNASGGRFLLGLQGLPVSDHRRQLLVGGPGHAGDRVHAFLGAVGKGGDHLAQALDVGAALGQGLQIGVVVLPVGDLALQGRIDGARARCNDACGLVPELVLSRYALQGGVVCLGVGGHKGVDFFLDASDRSLEFLRLGGGLSGHIYIGSAGGSHPVYCYLR